MVKIILEEKTTEKGKTAIYINSEEVRELLRIKHEDAGKKSLSKCEKADIHIPNTKQGKKDKLKLFGHPAAHIEKIDKAKILG